jgi:signal transduction histidine kinase
MSSTRTPIRPWNRIDVRLAVFIGGFAALLNALMVLAFTLYAVHESLEREAGWLQESADKLAVEIEAGQAARGEHAPRPVTFRVLRPDVAASAEDPWPGSPPGARWDRPTLHVALTATPLDHLIARSAAGDRTVEAALPLAGFVEERRELLRASIAVAAIGFLASLLVGIVSAWRALRPVREMGAAMRSIRAHSHLGVRVEERGSGDDVDALARSINELLGRLTWSFDRLSAFSGDVAHELRTPLHRLLNESTPLLLDDAGDPRQSIVTIHEAAEQMRDLVNQLLLLASGEEGRLALKRENVNLRDLCSRLVEFYRPLAESVGKTILLEAVGVDASCDPTLIERALANLIENAIKHSRDGEAIVFRLEKVKNSIQMGVLDSGPGIPVADRKRIFERFVRLDPARHGQGGGLGLPIARMIARLHGGDLRVTSAPTAGAAFWLDLPLDPPDALEDDADRRATAARSDPAL